jgi:hypothetical protein
MKDIYTELTTNPNFYFRLEFQNIEWNGITNTGIVYHKNISKGRIFDSSNLQISSIASDEIRKFYINKYFSNCLIYDGNIKLSDIDIDKIEFNKENKTITQNNVTVDIKNINSKEIKKFYFSKLLENSKQLDIKDIQTLVRQVHDSIKYDNIRGVHAIDEKQFNSLSEYHKLCILKKHFVRDYKVLCMENNRSSIHRLKIFKNKDFLYNVFKQHPNILIELLEQQIICNQYLTFSYLLQENKRNIIFKKDTYKKLLEISLKYNKNVMFDEYNRIIMQYEAEDMLFNNDDDIIEKEKQLEVNNHEILLLEKDKEIERLKLEMEELKKFYINS